jgi:hypothetical protein
LDTGASSASGAGQNLTLNLALTFNPSWAGTKNSYLTAWDRGSFTSGSPQLGTWSVGTPAAAPAITPAAGTYSAAQAVALTSATSGAAIRYTTDGSTPSETAGSLYAGPFLVSATATVKAIAYKSGLLDSAVTSAVYTIVPPPVVTSVSPTTATGGTSVTITGTGFGAVQATVWLGIAPGAVVSWSATHCGDGGPECQIGDGAGSTERGMVEWRDIQRERRHDFKRNANHWRARDASDD